jgi:hypothetical protein
VCLGKWNSFKNPKFFTRKRPKGIDIDFDYNEFTFSDKTRAPFSELSGYEVTPIISKAVFDEIRQNINRNFNNTIRKLRDSNDGELAGSFKPYLTKHEHTFAWQTKYGISAYSLSLVSG